MSNAIGPKTDARKAYITKTIVIMVGIALLFLGFAAWVVGQSDGGGGFGAFMMLIGAAILGVYFVQWLLGLSRRSASLSSGGPVAQPVSSGSMPEGFIPKVWRVDPGDSRV